MIHLDEKDELAGGSQPIAASEPADNAANMPTVADDLGEVEELEIELENAESEDEADIQTEDEDFSGKLPNWCIPG